MSKYRGAIDCALKFRGEIERKRKSGAVERKLKCSGTIEHGLKYGGDILCAQKYRGAIVLNGKIPVFPAAPDFDIVNPPVVATSYLYGTPSDSGNIGLRSGDSVSYYDGAVLPKLPEWDKSKYPHIRIRLDSPWYYVEFLSTLPVTTMFDPIIGDNYERNGMETSGEWGSCALTIGVDEDWSEVQYVNNNYHSARLDTILWANYDIYHTDGTIYLLASDPIPVSGIVDYVGDIPIYE